MKKVKAIMKHFEVWIKLLLICVSGPVAIGLLARWHDAAPLFAVLALIIIPLVIKLDKKVGPTDF